MKEVRGPWTEEEDKFLKDNIKRMTHQELADRLHRTRSSVGHRITLFQLKRQRKWFWSEEDDRFLRENLQTKSNKEIAQHLNRTESSVISRVNTLGLETGRHRVWKEDDDSFIVENVGNMTIQAISEHLGCSRSQAERRAMKLGVYERKPLNPETSKRARDKLEFEDGIRKRTVYQGSSDLVEKKENNPFHMIF